MLDNLKEESGLRGHSTVLSQEYTGFARIQDGVSVHKEVYTGAEEGTSILYISQPE